MKLSHVFLLATDLETLTEFYRDRLGLALTYHEPGTCAFFELGGTRLALYPGRTRTEPADMFLVLDVDDLALTVATLATRGVACEPIRTVPFGHAADLHDPEGNRIELHQSDS